MGVEMGGVGAELLASNSNSGKTLPGLPEATAASGVPIQSQLGQLQALFNQATTFSSYELGEGDVKFTVKTNSAMSSDLRKAVNDVTDFYTPLFISEPITTNDGTTVTLYIYATEEGRNTLDTENPLTYRYLIENGEGSTFVHGDPTSTPEKIPSNWSLYETAPYPIPDHLAYDGSNAFSLSSVATTNTQSRQASTNGEAFSTITHPPVQHLIDRGFLPSDYVVSDEPKSSHYLFIQALTQPEYPEAETFREFETLLGAHYAKILPIDNALRDRLLAHTKYTNAQLDYLRSVNDALKSIEVIGEHNIQTMRGITDFLDVATSRNAGEFSEQDYLDMYNIMKQANLSGYTSFIPMAKSLESPLKEQWAQLETASSALPRPLSEKIREIGGHFNQLDILLGRASTAVGNDFFGPNLEGNFYESLLESLDKRIVDHNPYYYIPSTTEILDEISALALEVPQAGISFSRVHHFASWRELSEGYRTKDSEMDSDTILWTQIGLRDPSSASITNTQESRNHGIRISEIQFVTPEERSSGITAMPDYITQSEGAVMISVAVKTNGSRVDEIAEAFERATRYLERERDTLPDLFQAQRPFNLHFVTQIKVDGLKDGFPDWTSNYLAKSPLHPNKRETQIINFILLPENLDANEFSTDGVVIKERV